MAEINKANITVPEMKLELVPVPVSDVDRAKAFYEVVLQKLSENSMGRKLPVLVQLRRPLQRGGRRR